MKFIKKLSIATLLLTMLFSTFVYANETETEPTYEESEEYETDGYFPPPVTEQITGEYDVSLNEVIAGVQPSGDGTYVGLITNSHGAEDVDLAYTSYKSFLSEIARWYEEFIVVVEDSTGKQSEINFSPVLDYHNYIELTPDTYTVVEFQWNVDGEYEVVSLDYINTTTFNITEDEAPVDIVADIGKLHFDNEKKNSITSIVCGAGYNFLYFAFVDEDAFGDVYIPENSITSKPSTEPPTIQGTIIEKPTIEPSTEEVTVTEPSTEESKENDKNGKNGANWLKNNAFTLIIFVGAIAAYGIYLLKTKQKTS